MSIPVSITATTIRLGLPVVTSQASGVSMSASIVPPNSPVFSWYHWSRNWESFGMRAG